MNPNGQRIGRSLSVGSERRALSEVGKEARILLERVSGEQRVKGANRLFKNVKGGGMIKNPGLAVTRRF